MRDREFWVQLQQPAAAAACLAHREVQHTRRAVSRRPDRLQQYVARCFSQHPDDWLCHYTIYTAQQLLVAALSFPPTHQEASLKTRNPQSQISCGWLAVRLFGCSGFCLLFLFCVVFCLVLLSVCSAVCWFVCCSKPPRFFFLCFFCCFLCVNNYHVS